MILNLETMRISSGYGILFLISIVVWSCEERFTPDIKPSAENLLVVDGMISNLPGPYTIKLSMSSELDNPEFVAVSGFTVAIVDDRGNSHSLAETSAGRYVTTDENFRGTPGHAYRLEMMAPDGQQYASQFEELQEPTAVKEIDHRLEYMQDDDLPYDIAGYRFYVSTDQAPADTNYFLWQLVSTYKYRADMLIYWFYDGELRPFPDRDSLQTCYKTDTVPEIFLLSTENLGQPVVTDFPLHYVTTETRHLMERYSLLVRQFSISRDAFRFWTIIREQNSNPGDLYSKLPFQVKGNVYNVSNENEAVLGRFTVAGASEKRIFVNRPKPPVKMRYPICEFHEGTYENFSAITEFPPIMWPIFATRGPDGNALPNLWCMDCRESGGVIDKPDFWINE